MTYDTLVNRGDYLSPHFVDEVLPKTLRTDLFDLWNDREADGRATPRKGLQSLRGVYYSEQYRGFFAGRAEQAAEAAVVSDVYRNEEWRTRLHDLHAGLLTALGFTPERHALTVRQAGRDHTVHVAYAATGVIAIECGWAKDVDAASDPAGPGMLLDPLRIDSQTEITTGARLASFLFAAEDRPRYVLILAGGVLFLADAAAWGEGRYLAVNLDAALARKDVSATGELPTIAALFGADALRTPEDGREPLLAQWVERSTQHAVGVSAELRTGLQDSVQYIANEILARLREAGVPLEDIPFDEEEGRESIARRLTRETLRYLYRILFLLYAEARPELGVLPADYPEYEKGYSLRRLGELIEHGAPVGEHARNGYHYYESLDLLFRKVNKGHRAKGSEPDDDLRTDDDETRAAKLKRRTEDLGLRFEPLRSDLFEPESIRLIGNDVLENPLHDPESRAGSAQPEFLDTRLRNETLFKVLRALMIADGDGRHKRGGFISYAQLGISQLGAVYEGLMSYTGSIADEPLYEVGRRGETKLGSWLVPLSKISAYPESVFVTPSGRAKGAAIASYQTGEFVYRLSGRDRATSASYYTPDSLTKATVHLALKHRLDPHGMRTAARELLSWKICEPALGSGAFLNAAIDQIAAEYLKRRQEELGTTIPPAQVPIESQRVKAYIALHNAYGVDLNATAVELAEISLWLNTMHPGMKAPWFGLHLRRGNSLIGASRRVYDAKELAGKAWSLANNALAPTELPFSEGALPSGVVHQFLLPGHGWGVIAKDEEVKGDLAPGPAAAMARWRSGVFKTPTKKQAQRLQGVARRAEFLWDLVVQRLRLSEQEISREIDVWEGGIEHPEKAGVAKEKVFNDLRSVDTPFWRLKTVMDTWCALWFWPVDEVGLLDGSADRYANQQAPAQPASAPPVDTTPADAEPAPQWQYATQAALFGDQQGDLTEESAFLEVRKPRTTTRTQQARRPAARRETVALKDLEDWLDFAEAVLGSAEISATDLVGHFDSLGDLEAYEDLIVAMMGMDRSLKLAERFPWLRTAERIAKEQGFFHWELYFAHIFVDRGGFDLQVGNPPWVQPEWKGDVVRADRVPWFMVTDETDVAVRQQHVDAFLADHDNHEFLLAEKSVNIATCAFLASPTVYPTLGGTLDFYRCFMVQAWNHIAPNGTTGLVHPDTHLEGGRDTTLRPEAYRRLRAHGSMVNVRNWAFALPASRTLEFGMHIYGAPSEIGFDHASKLFGADVLAQSIDCGEDDDADLPGIKYKGKWDTRARKARIVRIDNARLSAWQLLLGLEEEPVEATPLLHPVSTAEDGAMATLAKVKRRLGGESAQFTRGLNEKLDRVAGYFREQIGATATWDEVIMKGPNFTVATPFAKQEPHTHRQSRPIALTTLATDALPSTKYKPIGDRQRYVAKHDDWLDHERYRELCELSRRQVAERFAHISGIEASLFGGYHDQKLVEPLGEDGFDRLLRRLASRPCIEFYRVFWREYIADNGAWSLTAALMPPGPSHIHAVLSMALPDNRRTALAAGFWASLPLDYLLRVTGREHLQAAGARQMPAADPDHPLASALLLRTLRLNCVTSAYAPLWAELYDDAWSREQWVVNWPGMKELSMAKEAWSVETPLRTERERRAALLEIDALVAVMLGIGEKPLLAAFRSRYGILASYEAQMYFDTNGNRIAADNNAYGQRQDARAPYDAIDAYEASNHRHAAPKGYKAPFYKADREAELLQAHRAFSARVQAAIDRGDWQEPIQ